MKIQILITSLLICNSIFAKTFDTISLVYEKKINKKNLFLLQLLENSRYNFTHYLNRTVYHDSGTYSIKGHKIEFISELHPNWSRKYLRKKYHISSKGLFSNVIDVLLRKDPKYTVSTTYSSSMNWMHNPVTNSIISPKAYDLEKAKKTSGYRPISPEKLREIESAELAKLAQLQLEKEKADLNSKSLYVENNFRELVNKLIPEYNYLINMAYCGPGCYKELGGGSASFSRSNSKENKWSGDSSESYIIDNWGLIIHESTHKMNEEVINSSPPQNMDGSHKHNVDFVSKKYLIESDKLIKVDVNEYFKSEEMLSIIPVSLHPKERLKNVIILGGYQDPVQRFYTYISKGSHSSSNAYGIYGLLDEFSAYYHGSNALSKAAQNKVSLSYKNRELLLGEFSKHYTAYYEFNLFIAWYLHYAKLYRKDVYTSLMENDNLRIAYTLIDKQFEKCISDYFKIKLPDYFKLIYDYIYTSYVPKLKGYLATEQSYLDEFKLDSIPNYAE